MHRHATDFRDNSTSIGVSKAWLRLEAAAAIKKSCVPLNKQRFEHIQIASYSENPPRVHMGPTAVLKLMEVHALVGFCAFVQDD